MIDYEIVSTGSQDGNCLRVENVLFDIGVSFKKIRPTLIKYKIKAVFISHKHSDHYNKSTLHQLIAIFPWIKIIVNQDIADKIKSDFGRTFKNVVVIKDDTKVTIPSSDSTKYHSLIIRIFHTDHEIDLMSNGYQGEKVYNGATPSETFVFATDFWNINNLPKSKLDYFFLEANYQQDTFNKVLKEGSMPFWSVKGTDRHFSREQSHEYYLKHRKSEQSIYVPLHKSSRMYHSYDSLLTMMQNQQQKKTKPKQKEPTDFDTSDFSDLF